MKTKFAAVLALACLTGACVYTVPLYGPDGDEREMTPLAADRAQPKLALVEHLLTNYFGSDIASPPTVCAALSDGRSQSALPPDQEIQLIERFPQLAPLSRCVWNGSAWRDSETEAPALVFTVHSFSCASETKCSGWAGYTAGDTSSPSALYRMEFAAGRWSFERDRRLIAE